MKSALLSIWQAAEEHNKSSSILIISMKFAWRTLLSRLTLPLDPAQGND